MFPLYKLRLYHYQFNSIIIIIIYCLFTDTFSVLNPTEFSCTEFYLLNTSFNPSTYKDHDLLPVSIDIHTFFSSFVMTLNLPLLCIFYLPFLKKQLLKYSKKFKHLEMS